jgi:RND family efflux transporter MFP subunit
MQPPARLFVLALSLLLFAGTALAQTNSAAVENGVAPATVTVRPATEVLLPSTASAAAIVLSPNDTQLSAELAAPIAKVAADVGAQVARGALLIELDCTDTRLALAQAEAQVAAAQARVALVAQRLKRAETLAAKNFVSADELLALSTEKQAAQAEGKVTEAQRAVVARQVAKCRISAPFDAVVMERQAQVGALAAVGAPLIRLIDVSAVEVEARLAEADAGALEQAGQLEFESQQQRYPLRLLRVSPVLEATSRSRIARLGFVGEAAPAGSSGRLHWQAAGGRLPAELMVQRDGVLGVFTVEDGRARFVPVPGAQPGRPADVARAPGALLVVEGQQGLHDRMPVRRAED